MLPAKNSTNPSRAAIVKRHEYFRFVNLGLDEGSLLNPLVPLVVRRDDAQARQFAGIAYHALDFYIISVVLCGTALQHLNGVSCQCARGDVFAITPGAEYSTTYCENYISLTALFTKDIFSPAELTLLESTPGFHAFSLSGATPLHRLPGGRLFHLAPTDFERVEQIGTRMYEEYRFGTASGSLAARSLFIELLVMLCRLYSDHLGVFNANPMRYPDSPAITSAVQYLEENFMEDVRVEAIAASCFLSPDRFTKRFRAQIGQTPRDYLKHLRIEHAKKLLAETALTVADVGWECGFREAVYFIRAFRAVTGATPGVYRRSLSGKHLNLPLS